MTGFITLVRGTGFPVTIRIDDVDHLEPAHANKAPTLTLVHCKGKTTPWYVQETTEQILALIKGAAP
jgi:hypothetical protein